MRFVSNMVALCVSACAGVFACDSCGVSPRIIDGVNVPQSAFPTVGLIGDANGGFYCSGTLIAPHFVLSAAHCVVDGVSGQPSFPETEGRFLLNGVTYSTTHVYFNPSYKGDASQEVEGAVDLSIFELSQDVPGVTPSPLNRSTPTVGALLTLAGYGELGTGQKGVDGTFPADGTLDTGHVPIDTVTDTFLKWNFKQVPAPNQESNTAPGDSGGPQFLNIGGTLTVASVTSGGHKNNAAWGDVSYNTRVDIASVWIDSITGGVSTPGNNPPAIQSLTAAPNPATTGVEVTFSAAAVDVDNNPLNYHWIFGDGIEVIGAGATVSHIYGANGTYRVTVITTDGKGGSAAKDISVQVGDGIAKTARVLNAEKRQFMLNFKSPERSTLDVTLFSPDFVFSNKNDYLNVFDGSAVQLYIGTTRIDTIALFGLRARGAGTLTVNYKAGELRYSLRNDMDLLTALAPFGAVNADVKALLTVPVNMTIDRVLYSANVVFDYTAVHDKQGKGK